MWGVLWGEGGDDDERFNIRWGEENVRAARGGEGQRAKGRMIGPCDGGAGGVWMWVGGGWYGWVGCGVDGCEG